MKIDRARIDAFGQLRNFDLRLAPGLNLISGPNGAGKSTVLGFLRAVLFGFEKRKDPARYDTGAPELGGELHLTTPQGGLVVRRTAGSRAEGELTLRSREGDVLAPSRLTDALHGVTRELFFEVFAFGLGELQSFEKMSREGSVSEALFAAGTAGAQQLPQALDTLRKSSEEIFKVRGKKLLNVELARLSEVRHALDAMEDRPARYFEQLTRLAAVETELAQLDPAEARGAHEHARLQALHASFPGLLRWEALELELADANPGRAFPERATARFEESCGRMRAAEADLHALAEQTRIQEAELGKLEACPAAAVAAARETLLAFQGTLELRRTLPSRRAALQEKLRQAEREWTELGVACDAQGLLAADFSAPGRAPLAALRSEEGRLLALHAENSAALELTRAEQRRIEADLRRLEATSTGRPELTPPQLRQAQSALGEASLEALHLRSVDRELTELRKRREDVGKLVEPAPSSPGLRRDGAVAGLLWAVALAASCVLLSGRALLGAVAAATLLIALAALALRGRARELALARAAFDARERARTLEVRRLVERVQELEAEGQGARERLARALTTAGLEGSAEPPAVAARRVELEAQLALWSRASGWDEEVALARSELQAAELRARACAASLAEVAAEQLRVARAVGDWCRERHLPEGLSSAEVLQLVAELLAVRRRLLDARAEEEALRSDELGCKALEAPLTRAAGLLGVEGDAAEGVAARLAVRLEQLAEAARRRQALEMALGQLMSERLRLRSLLESEAALQTILLREAGVTDGEALRSAEAQHDAGIALGREARELRLTLEAAVRGSAGAALAEVHQMGGAQGLELRLQAAAAEVARLRSLQRALIEERTGLKLSIERAGGDEEVGKLRREEERRAAQASELAVRFAVQQLAIALLENARERYEQERQPAVVRRASGLFEELTDGRYVRVHVAVDGGRQLFATDDGGTAWPAEKLSRGTRELLFLAFRLALIEDLAHARGPLPIVLDDVLVNLDAERSRTTLRVLERLASRHQIIALTCHPAMRAQFEQVGAHVVELEAAAGTALLKRVS